MSEYDPQKPDQLDRILWTMTVIFGGLVSLFWIPVLLDWIISGDSSLWSTWTAP